MMSMTMHGLSPEVIMIATGVGIALGVASVVMRLVSDAIARGAVADMLASVSVLAGMWCLQTATLTATFSPLTWAAALLAVVFSVVGWRFPFRVWRKSCCGRKSRRAMRAKYYLIASLLHAPWVLAVVIAGVRIMVFFCLAEPLKRALMHKLLQTAEWGVLLLILFSLLRMWRKHQYAALRRCLMVSAPLCVLFLHLW